MNTEMAVDNHEREVLALLLTNQQQIHENIKFADVKASAITVLNLALLGELLKTHHDSLPEWMFTLVISVVLLVGISLAFSVVKPRGRRASERGVGVIDANRISQFNNDQEFRSECSKITSAELLNQMRTFIYDRAVIDKAKYKWLQYSLYVSAPTWVIVVLGLIWFSYPKVQAERPKEPDKCHGAVIGQISNESEVFRIEKSAVHSVANGKHEAHTFLVDEKKGTVWQMVCDAKGLVKFQEVKKVALTQ